MCKDILVIVCITALVLIAGRVLILNGTIGSNAAVASPMVGLAGYRANGGIIGKQQNQRSDRSYLLKTISYNPDNLLQMTGSDVRSILYEPELIRSDLPTIVWQYRTESCVLDIYFTSEGKTDPAILPVVHSEVRAREKNKSDDEVQGNCVRDLVEKRSRPRMVNVSTFYKSRI